MAKILILFAYISAFIVIGINSFFMIYTLFGKKNLFDTDLFNQISADLAKCKNSGILCVGLTWLYASCQPQTECLKVYNDLSDVCRQLGMIWVVIAFAAIIVSLISVIMKKSSSAVAILRGIRKSGFWTGLIYIVMAIVLKV